MASSIVFLLLFWRCGVLVYHLLDDIDQAKFGSSPLAQLHSTSFVSTTGGGSIWLSPISIAGAKSVDPIGGIGRDDSLCVNAS